MKKILIVNILPESVLPLKETFTELGYEVRSFDNATRHWLEQYGLKPLNKLLTSISKRVGLRRDFEIGRSSRFSVLAHRGEGIVRLASEFQPDLVLVIRGHEVSRRVIDKLKGELGVSKVVCWYTKGAKFYELPQGEAAHYDAYFLINNDFIDRLKGEGHGHVYYLPHTVNRKRFRKLNVTEADIRRHGCDIGFVGGCVSVRNEILRQMTQYKLKIYGSRWIKNNLCRPSMVRSVQGARIEGDELVKFYQIAKINLNVSVWQGRGNSGLNLRLFDVPACGGFLLTDYMEEIDEYYEIGKELEVYRDVDELKDKVAYYLKNDGKRNEIAQRGYEKSLKFDDWGKRLSWMLDVVEVPFKKNVDFIPSRANHPHPKRGEWRQGE